MKNSVRLLSVMLLISMLFSMSAVSASAIVSDGSSAGGMVIIGGTEAPVNNDGMLVIGAEQRPEDDSPYLGASIEDMPSYGQQVNAAKQQQAAAVTLNSIQEEAKKYLGLADADYSEIDNSTLKMVQDNKDFLKFVHDHYDDPSLVSPATLQTAVDMFGEDLVYGKEEATFDFDKAYADLSALNEQIAAFEEQFYAQYVPAPAEEAAPAVEEAPVEGEAAAEGEEGAEVCGGR